MNESTLETLVAEYMESWDCEELIRTIESREAFKSLQAIIKDEYLVTACDGYEDILNGVCYEYASEFFKVGVVKGVRLAKLILECQNNK